MKEDYSKEILEKRKQLQPQLEEEKKKGNIAYIKYDKLIVLNPKNNDGEKRKRETSDSPKSSALKKHQTSLFVALATSHKPYPKLPTGKRLSNQTY